MDLKLPLLADANLHLNIAEEAINEDSKLAAVYEIEKAEEALQELRQQWPELQENEQGLLSSMAKPLSERLRVLRQRIPQNVITQTKDVADPEQEIEPVE